MVRFETLLSAVGQFAVWAVGRSVSRSASPGVEGSLARPLGIHFGRTKLDPERAIFLIHPSVGPFIRLGSLDSDPHAQGAGGVLPARLLSHLMILLMIV